MKSPSATHESKRQAVLAALPEYLRRTLSDLSEPCHLRDAGSPALDTVRIVRPM